MRTIKYIDKAKDARRRARKAAQKPLAVQVIPDKRRKPAKHKKALDQEY